jgi:hypothetical protein
MRLRAQLAKARLYLVRRGPSLIPSPLMWECQGGAG